MNRDGIEVVQLLPAPPVGADQVGGLQDSQVLRCRLPGHVKLPAQLAQGLPVALAEAVEQIPPGRVGQCLEDLVILCGHRYYYAGNHLHVVKTRRRESANPQVTAVSARPEQTGRPKVLAGLLCWRSASALWAAGYQRPRCTTSSNGRRF